ncbi:DHA2 family efflux MFS transporter permease subunit [Microbacterium deminutum]
MGLVAISLSVAMIIVDSTIVNVAIPSIVKDLGITSTEVQWIQESYTLVFASFLLVFGAVADNIGRRRLLILGVVVFAVASVAAAFADSGAWLIGARLIQGLGGAAILPASLSLINSTFTGRERGIAFAIWGSTIGGMAAVGPLLGGWLTTSFSWRWAFGINIPIAIVIVVGVAVFVRESKSALPTRIDGGGAVLSVIAAGTLVFALIEGRTDGWWFAKDAPSIGALEWPFILSPIVFALLISASTIAGFVIRTIRRAAASKPTLIAPELFRIPSFRNGTTVAAIVSLGEFGIILALPLWLQNVLGYTALETGVVLLALALGSFGASGLASATVDRITPITSVRMGIVLEIIGLGALGLVISTDTPWWAIVIPLAVYGFGIGLATAQITNVALAGVPVGRSGQASGTQSTARQFGSALGIALLGTLLFTVLQLDLERRLDGVPGSDAIVSAVVGSAGTAMPELSIRFPDAADEARAALALATSWTAYAAAGFLAAGLLSTIKLRADSPTDRSRHTEIEHPVADAAASDS